MYTIVLILENATMTKINLKNGLNIVSSYFCIDIHNEHISITPHQPGLINGNILENETELRENDTLNFGSSHFIIRKAEPIIIDLTDEEDITPYSNLNERLTPELYAQCPDWD